MNTAALPPNFPALKASRPALVAMIHLGALPGTPFAASGTAAEQASLPARLAEQAAREAALYRDAGVDALLLENMHDRPYLRRSVGPEITAAMTLAAAAVRAEAPALPIGVQILAGANREALAVALACGLDFIRAEAFVFGHLADEGWMDADAGELLRYRRHIGASQVAIWTDLRKKHASHAGSADLSLADWAREATFAGAAAVILTGASTGHAADPAALDQVRAACPLPVVIGSGICPENAAAYRSADAWIVGSSLKQGGHWAAAPDPARVEAMVREAQRAR
ncbi:MAG: BtpA/SgcQ family protein [Bacteroidetes bacterium]|nr:BtpA/SgcQ family protein [Bacteroidota bacterium]